MSHERRVYILIYYDLKKDQDIPTTLQTMNSIKKTSGTWDAYDIMAKEINPETVESLHKIILCNICKLFSIRVAFTPPVMEE